MMTMNVSACHDVAVIDLTNLESCRSFRMNYDNSACECDEQDRYHDDGDWDDGDNWSDDEESESDKPSCSAWKGALVRVSNWAVPVRADLQS